MALVRMTRRVSFSSGHRYWIPSKTEEENRALFGRWASPFNHGHNYVLDVTVEGAVDARTGMVVNIKRIDDVLKERVVSEFDGRSINDEVSVFRERASTLENLMAYLWEVLAEPGRLPREARLVGLRLEETPLLYGELYFRDVERIVTLTRVYEFAASHRLHSFALSNEENQAIFGKCNHAGGHGHNYVLEVTVQGEPDQRTGMMVDLGALDARVHELVVDRYDHRNLNEDLPELEGKPTTSEVVAEEIFRALEGRLPAKLYRVRLHETARNIFEVTASQ